MNSFEFGDCEIEDCEIEDYKSENYVLKEKLKIYRHANTVLIVCFWLLSFALIASLIIKD